MNWLYKGRPISEISDMPEGVFGFTYCITTDDSRKYIGKKTLFSKRKRKFGKKESALITDKRKKLYEIVIKESEWKDYMGSNDELKKVVSKGMGYTKEILQFAFHKKQLSYLENRELYERRVLELGDKYYNSNIAGSFYKKDV